MRQQANVPSSVISSHSMHLGVLATAWHAIPTGTTFTVYYKPRYWENQVVEDHLHRQWLALSRNGKSLTHKTQSIHGSRSTLTRKGKLFLFPYANSSRYYWGRELIFGATYYTTTIDIWSGGCVLAELLLGQITTSQS